MNNLFRRLRVDIGGALCPARLSWAQLHHLQPVADLLAGAFPADGWSAEKLRAWSGAKPGRVMRVAEVKVGRSWRAAGATLYRLTGEEAVAIVRVVVLPDLRRQGLGRLLVGVGMVGPDGCSAERYSAKVGESNLGAQLFFKSLGFTGRSEEVGVYKFTFVRSQ